MSLGSPEQQAPHDFLIEAGRTEKQYWRDLWRYRELFAFLAWRDIAVRYKQTIFGVLWALVQPLATAVVFTIIFSKVAGMKAPEGIPYPLLVLVGTLSWTFFATALSNCSNSLVGSSNLLTKVYFPRLVVPVSSIVVAFVDFFITFVILCAMMAYFQFVPSWRIVFLPAFLAIAFGAAMGLGLWLASLNVEYRDFRFVLPFIVQFGFYVSPVGFSSSNIPEEWRLLYSLNPMATVIDGFRWSVLGIDGELYWQGLVGSLVIVGTLLASGIWYFRRMERTFADVI